MAGNLALRKGQTEFFHLRERNACKEPKYNFTIRAKFIVIIVDKFQENLG